MAGSLQLGACAFIDCKALTAAQFPVGTGFGQYAVGYQDEDGRPMTAFTLRGLTGTTAQYYADATAQITFDPALELTQGATFGNTFQSYSGTDWYRYTPTATGTYHFTPWAVWTRWCAYATAARRTWGKAATTVPFMI